MDEEHQPRSSRSAATAADADPLLSRAAPILTSVFRVGRVSPPVAASFASAAAAAGYRAAAIGRS